VAYGPDSIWDKSRILTPSNNDIDFNSLSPFHPSTFHPSTLPPFPDYPTSQINRFLERAEHFLHHVGYFADGGIGLDRLEDERHQVVLPLRRITQPVERRPYRSVVPFGLHVLQPVYLFPGDRRVIFVELDSLFLFCLFLAVLVRADLTISPLWSFFSRM